MVRSFVQVCSGLAINSVGPGLVPPLGPEILTLLHTGPLASGFYVVPVTVTIFLDKDLAKISRTNRYLSPKRKGYICVPTSVGTARWMLFTLLPFSQVSVFSFSSRLRFRPPALLAYWPTFVRPRGEMEVSERECVTARINIISRTIRRKFCHDRDII